MAALQDAGESETHNLACPIKDNLVGEGPFKSFHSHLFRAKGKTLGAGVETPKTGEGQTFACDTGM